MVDSTVADDLEKADEALRERAEKEAAIREQEEDAIFEAVAKSHREHGNLNNLPSDFSASNSDSDEDDPDEGSDEDDDEPGSNPQATAGDEPGKKSPPSDDLWAGATEAQRKEFDRLEHADRSNRGRVSALQQQINDLKQQLAQPAKREEAPVVADEIDDDALKQFEDDYPEIADVLKRMQAKNQRLIKEQQTQLAGVQQVVDPIIRNRVQQERQSELDLLTREHPDALAIAESQAFQSWLQGQGPVIQQMFKSTLAEDNINLLHIYKQRHNIKPPASAADGDSDDDDRLSDMEGLPSKRGGPRSSPGVNLSDEDAIFEAYAKKHAETGTI